MSKYPLCARAGLNIYSRDAVGSYNAERAKEIIPAADVEKLLEGAPVVYVRQYDNQVFGEWYDKPQEDDTHTARLVMIEPIKPKSLEDKILEVLDDHSKSATESLTAIRRLLEGK